MSRLVMFHRTVRLLSTATSVAARDDADPALLDQIDGERRRCPAHIDRPTHRGVRVPGMPPVAVGFAAT